MKLIVFSSHNGFRSEPKQVIRMFEHGLETLHLRKPYFSSKNLVEYLELIPAEYHNRIVIHSHHKLAKRFNLKGVHFSKVHRDKNYNTKLKYMSFRLRFGNILTTRSCHKIHKLDDNPNRYSYVFLSPMFESISKKSHCGLFSERHIKKALATKKCAVYALGGVDESKFKELNSLGFEGVALLGAIWDIDKDPFNAYLSATVAMKNLDKQKIMV
jgi:thiamine-phosphate pyrophosphorylase